MVIEVRGRTARRAGVVVNQMALASYREGFLRELEKSDGDVLFLVGDEHFGKGVVTDVSSNLVRRTGRNVFLLGRRAGWQRGCLWPGLRARTLVVELNPRNLTSWLLVACRRLLGRRTAGWGHAHSRRGPRPEYNRTRRVMQAMCTDLVAYTETESRQLSTLFPGKRVLPARNALYSVSEMSRYPVAEPADRTDLVIIGRLVPEKKVLLGLEAFALAKADIPDDVVLHVVGSGPQRRQVLDVVARAGERVRYHGYLTGLANLAPIFQRCRALLAPGYVGLNAVQALGFGVPVLYARDEDHAPEIEALDPTNSTAFATDDARSCAAAIVALYRDPGTFDARLIAQTARARFSTDRMIEPFLTLGEKT